MRLFIVNYIISVIILMMLSSPSVMAAPIDIVPRLMFYLAFSSAVLLSFLYIIAEYVVIKLRRPVGIDRLAVSASA